MERILFVLCVFLFPFGLNAQSTTPPPLEAGISSTSSSVILTGSTVQLTGSAVNNPSSQTVSYNWSFTKKPASSTASFSTPSPSQPQFTADKPGIYVVQLNVNNYESTSEPEFLFFSVVDSVGTAVMPERTFSTPSLCALTFGFFGCDSVSHSFTATAGSDYVLTVSNNSATSLSVVLNSNTIINVPSNLESDRKFVIPVSLLATNQLQVTVKGGVGSSVNIEVKRNTLPQDNNSAPVVADLNLLASISRFVSGSLSISDSDTGQSHVSELLIESTRTYNYLLNNRISFSSQSFSYRSPEGFKGIESFYFLTRDSGIPAKAVISKVIINVRFNTAPELVSNQIILIPKANDSFTITLPLATDLENDSLTYSIVENPERGTLSNCTSNSLGFSCQYTLPQDFTTNVKFTYKANDGREDSNTSEVILKPFSPNAIITRIVSGAGHTCALFNEGNIRCWGGNRYGQLGYNHTNTIGDDETPLSQGDVELGGEAIDISLGGEFTCALLKTNKVKCWGYNRFAQLGLGSSGLHTNILEPPDETINFGTSIKIIDIESGYRHSCALFETGRAKCWGQNHDGELGLGHSNDIGDDEQLDNIDFIKFDKKIISLSLGGSHSCALLDNNEIKCWGWNPSGQLGLGHRQRVGDSQLSLPSSFLSVSLGGQAIGIGTGEDFNCAILNNGQAKCWGENRYGQLGLRHFRDIGDDEFPSSIGTLNFGERRVRKISSGNISSCALLDNGDVRCFGANSSGSLGLGHTDSLFNSQFNSQSLIGDAVNLSESAIDISTGYSFSCALLKSGKLKCWGDNSGGQLGLGHTNNIGDDETLQNVASPDTGGNIAPVYPRFSFSPINPKVSNQVSFNAGDSFAKNPITSYAWDFGGGSTATGVSVNKTFTSAGNHTVRLTVTDNQGNSQFQEKVVLVESVNGRLIMPERQQIYKTQKNKPFILTLMGAENSREGATLSYSIVDIPSSGTLSECLGISGSPGLSCKYTPVQDFVGTVSFSYKGNDGTDDSINRANVRIRILEPRPTVIKIASSNNHACALYDNKKIKCWGHNLYGQLGYGRNVGNIGDNETVESQNFIDVGGNVIDVATGDNHTCALLENKSVKCWGDNRSGQLFLGSIQNIFSPSNKALELGFRVKQIAINGDTNCVLSEQGLVKCWGENDSGQLGIGSTDAWGDSEYETFEKLPFLALGRKAKKISVGKNHACAVLDNSSLKCWGNNLYGQLGYGHTNNIGDNETLSSISEISLGTTAVVDLFLGLGNTCVLLSDKNAKCWGRNNSGQLGYGHTNNIGDNETLTSLGVLDFTLDIEQMILGAGYSCALLSDRKLRCWGYRFGFPDTFRVPVSSGSITSISDAFVIDRDDVAMASILGSGDFDSSACLLLGSGEVHCWGENDYGRLGVGHTRDIYYDSPIFIPENSIFPNQSLPLIARFNYFSNSSNLKTLQFDASSSFFQGSSATYSWNFGDGTPVVTGKIVNHTFSQSGTYSVQLTIRDLANQTNQVTKNIVIGPENALPVLISQQEFSVLQGSTVRLNLKNAFDIDSTSLTYSVVGNPSQGTLSNCSYSNSSVTCRYQAPTDFTGQTQFTYKANDGTTDSNLSTVKLNILASDPLILQLSAGHEHTCALYENKKVRCWGRNNFGQLGYGHTNNIGDDEFPSNQGFVDVGSNVIGLSTGRNHTCVLLENQSVKCWGENRYGQLALSHTNNIIGDNELPSSIGSIALGESVKKVVSGDRSSCALTESGRVKCWGWNDSGELGLSSSDSERIVRTNLRFSQIGGRAINLFSGGSHVCALFKEGRIRCWGDNENGKLGYGHTNNIGDDEHPFRAGNVNVGQRVQDMALSSNHTCALLEDKSVKCWGESRWGQLGPSHLSDVGDNELPSSINSIRFDVDAKKIIAGNRFTCTVLVNNNIICWGSNTSGNFAQINYGFLSQTNIGDILDITAFSNHICALLKNGQTKCWGRNNFGQLGLGHIRNIGNNENLIIVDNIEIGGRANHLISRFMYTKQTASTVNFNASSSYSSSSITSYSWNFGDNTTTGTGQTTTHTYASAGTYTVTLTVTDSLNQTDTFSEKIKIDMPNSPPFFLNAFQSFTVHQGEVTSLSLEPGTDSESTSNLTYTLVDSPANGTLSDCLGGTSDIICNYTPDEVSIDDVTFTYKVNDGSVDSLEVVTVSLSVLPPKSPIIDISLGSDHSCVLFQNGKIKCWGQNNSGQLGYGNRNQIGHNNTPPLSELNLIDLGVDAIQIASGGASNCAVLTDGNIKCWGLNRFGQLGYGHTNNIGDNETLSSVDSISLGQKVVQISLGKEYDSHACALLETGDVKCWGSNRFGRLGYGPRSSMNGNLETLSTLELGGKAVKVVAGYNSSCAIMEGGGLKCWGQNNRGQLGYGHTNTIGDDETLSGLETISLPESVIDVEIYSYNTCAIFQSGNSKCWGESRGVGQRVSDNIGDNETPFDLPNLNFGMLVDNFSAGDNHACALLRDNSIKCWGQNNYGQLGLGDPTNSRTSLVTNTTAVSLGQNAIDLASGEDHNCALLVNGTLKCWGQNDYGQLGLSHTNNIGDNESPNNITFIGGEKTSSPIARIKTNFVLGTEDTAITFDASSSYSSDPLTETYSWDFGDDSEEVTTQSTSHTFTDPGTYTVSLTITDENSNTHTASKDITILNDPGDDMDDNDMDGDMMRGPASDDDDNDDDNDDETTDGESSDE